MKRYAAGLDYGTNTCRALIVDLDDGSEVASRVFAYPHGDEGILLDAGDPLLARQHPQDYIDALGALRDAVADAGEQDPAFRPEHVIGIGVDTTGSTPLPVDAQGLPLALQDAFRDHPGAMAWLWKDHTSHAEAQEITERAAEHRPRYLARCGGTYSSEWFWSKVLRCCRCAPEVFSAAHSFVELCDFVPALLTGTTSTVNLRRSVCAAGHKALYDPSWGGLPDADFLGLLDPGLQALRPRLYDKAYTADQRAGTLTPEWAEKLGLRPGIAVAVGAFDAHMGAVGSGIAPGTLVKILGTSTCDMMVQPETSDLADIPGVCGIVAGSILPGYFGIEAGQSAVGDLFLWLVRHLTPAKYGRTADERFAALMQAAEKLAPGEHGLLALDWNNGNRTILVDARLTGLLLGQTLHTEAHEIFRALIEATAFGARTIIDRIEEYGVPVNDIVTCGGLAVKNPLLMQIYADVTGRPLKITRSDLTCALGAALFGAVAAGPAAGGFAGVDEAQQALCAVRDQEYRPAAAEHAVYNELYALYRTLHDAFGTASGTDCLQRVMKDLLDLRDRVRRSGTMP